MITLRNFYALRMERWLRERHEDVVLRPPIIENGDFEQESSTYDRDIAIGQIRLLPIWMCGAVPRCLVYAAIIGSLPDDLWTVALFSPYGEPANQNEFRTGFAPANDPPDLALRTLCLWNSFPLPSHLLGKSWIIHDLSPGDLNAIGLIQGVPVPELSKDLQARIGPPSEISAFAIEELHGYMAEEEAISETILSHLHSSAKPENNIIAPNRWQDLVLREAQPMSSPEDAYASGNFGVWMTNVPASVFSTKANDPSFPTPLTLHKEASEFWKNKAPEIVYGDNNTISLVWKTETQIDRGQYEDFLNADFHKIGKMRYAPPPKRSRPHPDIPPAEVLLYDGATSKLIGRGSVSANGLQITLESTTPPQGPLQIVLCKQ